MNILPATIEKSAENGFTIDLNLVSFSIPKRPIVLEKNITIVDNFKLGIKPDDIKLSEEKNEQYEQNGRLLEGQIELVERSERGFVVYFVSGKTTLIAFASDHPRKSHQFAWIPVSKIYFFDAESGRRIEREVPS